MKVISTLSLSLGLIFVACSHQKNESDTRAVADKAPVEKTEFELAKEGLLKEISATFGKDYRPVIHCFTDGDQEGGGGHASLFLMGKLKPAVKGKKPKLETLIHPEPPKDDGLSRDIRGAKGKFGKRSWAGNTWTYEITDGTIKWQDLSKSDGTNPDRPLKSITYDAVKKTIVLKIIVGKTQQLSSHKNCWIYTPELLP